MLQKSAFKGIHCDSLCCIARKLCSHRHVSLKNLHAEGVSGVQALGTTVERVMSSLCIIFPGDNRSVQAP